MTTTSNPTTHRVGLAVEPEGRRLDFASLYEPRRVRSLVRAALRSSGLGSEDPERPLADLVRPGASVLLKPNWVLHRNEGTGGEECLTTQPEFVLAALEEVLAARPGRVVIGDAPIQSCRWPELVTEGYEAALRERADRAGVPLEILDFRRVIMRSRNVVTHVDKETRERDHYVLFDLGADSFLEEITTDERRFRVSDYDPDELARTHHAGRHQYLMCREAFTADVVISLPKLKTHCKAGLTGALKNLVGINGNKDFLPHHRRGGSEAGGDCYPGRSLPMQLAERLEDAANRRIGRPGHAVWYGISRATKLLAGGTGGRMTAAWHGNDTCWRMVLDLNRTLRYGRADGSLADTPQRRLYSLTDALLCGQGEGPLRPEPLPLGAVSFGADPIAAEIVHAALLGMDPGRLALIREAVRPVRWPLADGPVEPVVHCGEEVLTPDEVAERFGVAAEPAAGWRGHVERRPALRAAS